MAVAANAANVIGINFARDGGGQTTGTADQLTDWTNVYDTDGFNGDQNVAISGSLSAKASWVASNSWWAGPNDSSERRIYACYLDDGATSNYTLGGFTGDGTGIRLQISGLLQWLVGEGQTAYQIRVYASTDTNGGSFQPITIHSGSANGLSLETVNVPIMGDGGFPDSTTGGDGIRGYADFMGLFTDDTLTLTVPARSGSIRGTLAAIRIIAVPEPCTMVALAAGMGSIVGLHRRRSKA
jgi:hypothetical protein